MTPRSLFNIILKVIGIFLLSDVLGSISQFILTVINWLGKEQLENYIIICLFSFLGLATYFIIVYFLLFKSDKIINLFKLDKNFEQEEFNFRIHRSTVLNIVILITGGMLLFDSIPMLFRQIYLWQQYRIAMPHFTDKPFDFSSIIVYSVKLVIGLILLGNSKTIVNYIELKRKG